MLLLLLLLLLVVEVAARGQRGRNSPLLGQRLAGRRRGLARRRLAVKLLPTSAPDELFVRLQREQREPLGRSLGRRLGPVALERKAAPLKELAPGGPSLAQARECLPARLEEPLVQVAQFAFNFSLLLLLLLQLAVALVAAVASAGNETRGGRPLLGQLTRVGRRVERVVVVVVVVLFVVVLRVVADKLRAQIGRGDPARLGILSPVSQAPPPPLGPPPGRLLAVGLRQGAQKRVVGQRGLAGSLEGLQALPLLRLRLLVLHGCSRATFCERKLATFYNLK